MSERPNPSSLPPSIRPDPKSVEEIDEAWGEAEPVLSQPPQKSFSGELFSAESRTTKPGPEPDLTRLEPAIVSEPPRVAAAEAAPESEPSSIAEAHSTPLAGESASATPVPHEPAARVHLPSKGVDSLEPREIGSESRPQASRRGWVYAAVGIAALGAVFVLQGRDSDTVEEAPAARPAASLPPVATVAADDDVADTTLAEEKVEARDDTPVPAGSVAPGASAPGEVEEAAKAGEVEEVAEADEVDPKEAAKDESADGAPRKVRLRVLPPDAEIYRQGKRVGKGEATIEIEPGERKAFEVYREGYVLRKVTLDGSESEVSIGLRPKTKSPSKR